MLAGKSDLAKAFFYPVKVIKVRRRNRSHTNNGIHRRTDIMAHIRQELALCNVGRAGAVKGALQHLSLLFFFMPLLINPAGYQDCQLILGIWIVHMDDLCGCPMIISIFQHLLGFQEYFFPAPIQGGLEAVRLKPVFKFSQMIRVHDPCKFPVQLGIGFLLPKTCHEPWLDIDKL